MSVRPGHTDEQIIALARKANQSIFWRTCAILSIAATGIVGVLAAHASSQAGEASRDVKATQVEGCLASVRPNGVRYIDADRIFREQQSSDALNLDKQKTADAFGITVAQLKQAQQDQAFASQQQIQALLDVDCSTGRAIPAHTPDFQPPDTLGQPLPAGSQ